MRAIGTFALMAPAAAVAVAVAVALGAPALSAGAQPAPYVSRCLPGREARGCKLGGTGYGDLKTHLFVDFSTSTSTSTKGASAELSMPASSVCKRVTQEISVFAKGRGAPKVGSTIFFSGKAVIESAATRDSASNAEVRSATVMAKLKLSDAKTAELTGRAQVTLAGGAKCGQALPRRLERVLGG